MPVPLRRPDGTVVWLPEEQVNHAIGLGFTPENATSIAADVTPVEDTEGGLSGAVKAGVSSLASGATIGLSDVALKGLLSQDDIDSIKQAREDHRGISVGANIVGAALPAFFSGGATAEASAAEIAGEGLSGVRSLVAATPAAKVARLGARIAEGGEGMGLAGRTAAVATAGATEGALQNAGGYISDVALGDRKLSADGFVGAMGQGALWGGVAGGALSLSSEGLTAARRLFPGSEMTAEGAKAARQAATSEIQTAVADSDQLAQTAESQLREMRAQEEIANPGFKQRIEEIKLKAAQDVADAKVAAAQSKAQVAGARAKSAELDLESKATRAANKATTKRTKPALDFLKQFETPVEEEAGAASSLEQQLAGTKAALDQGKGIAEVGAARGPQVIEDAMNAELAKVNPGAAKINEALVRAKDSKQAMSEWLDKYGGDSAVAYDAASPAARRQKIADWAKNAPVSDEAGQVAQQHFLSEPENMKVRLGGESSPEVTKAANEAAAEAAHRAYLEAVPEAANKSVSGTELMARSRYEAQRAAAKAQDEVHTAARAGAPKAPTGDEIIASTEPVSAKIDKALAAKPANINDDIAETAPMITRHEAAHADLTEVLGRTAPPSSQARAQGFRDAQRDAAGKADEQLKLTQEVITKAPPTSVGRQLLSKAGDAAALYEALHAMGVPLPDPGKLPVIGPLLKTYMRAKLLGKAFGRHGGKVAETAETTIAAKAAVMRQRIYKAVDAGLKGASSVAGVAAKQGGGVAAALGHTLFDAKGSKTEPAPYSSEPAKGSLGELYLARAAEVEAAMRPDAIANAIKSRVRTSDPEALQEIIATNERKLQYLAKEMPRPSSAPGVLDNRIWLPSKADLTEWSKCIAAVDDPGNVMERAALGKATAKEIEAVKTVYPALYADGQQRVMKQIADGNVGKLSTTQKSQLSRTWGIPLDSVSQPSHTAWMQQSYQAQPPAPQPSAPMGNPTIAGPMNIGQRTMTRLDQGA